MKLQDEYKIFNDYFFERARKYVKNEITQEEVDLYTLGKIRKIYGSFEELLLDNIEYYSRIVRTVLWLYENTLVHNGKIITKVDKVKYSIPMTATRFYYICLTQIDFTRDEILYGYPQLGAACKGNNLVEFFKQLLKIGSFAFNVAFSTEQANTKSYQRAFELDTTNNDYLHRVIVNSKFVYIDKLILSADIKNIVQINELTMCNYNDMKYYETSNDIIDSRPNGISYLGPGYSELIKFNSINEIIRTQSGSIKATIDFDIHYSRLQEDINIVGNQIHNLLSNIDNLKIVCSSMITNYRKQFKAVRIHHDERCYSVLRVRKFWNIYKVFETCYINNTILYNKVFIIGKLHKLVNYITNNGYFVFTISSIEDIFQLAKLDDMESILEHYSNYINKTFVDSTARLELIEQETNKVITKLTRYSLIDEQ